MLMSRLYIFMSATLFDHYGNCEGNAQHLQAQNTDVAQTQKRTRVFESDFKWTVRVTK